MTRRIHFIQTFVLFLILSIKGLEARWQKFIYVGEKYHKTISYISKVSNTSPKFVTERAAKYGIEGLRDWF